MTGIVIYFPDTADNDAPDEKKERKAEPELHTTLYVQNLDLETTEEQIKKVTLGSQRTPRHTFTPTSYLVFVIYKIYFYPDSLAMIFMINSLCPKSQEDIYVPFH